NIDRGGWLTLQFGMTGALQFVGKPDGEPPFTRVRLLMEQQVIAGIGNIYSDEILFQARINPAERIDKLSPNQFKHLFVEMRRVLKTAVARGAGSEQLVERMPKGSLLPERNKGGRCPRCRSVLKIFKIGGRTAYCCRRCQGC